MDPIDEAAARVARGDNDAFDEIVEATSGKLVRLAARMMGSLEEGEDVVQEAYLRAYRALTEGSFDGRSRVETWLYRIVTNVSIDALRAQKRKAATSAIEQAEPSWDGASSAEARVALAELGDWLSELPPDQRAAITLKAVESLSSNEIASLMGTTEGAIEQLLVRARAALRKRRDDA